MFYLITSTALSPSVANLTFIGTSKVDERYVYKINVKSMGDATSVVSGIEDHQVTRTCPELVESPGIPPLVSTLASYHFGLK